MKHIVETEGKIVVMSSAKKIFRLFITSVLFTAAAVYYYMSSVDSSDAALGLMSIALGLGGCAAVVHDFARRRNPVLVLSLDGLFMPKSGVKKVVPWSDISQVGIIVQKVKTKFSTVQQYYLAVELNQETKNNYVTETGPVMEKIVSTLMPSNMRPDMITLELDLPYKATEILKYFERFPVRISKA